MSINIFELGDDPTEGSLLTPALAGNGKTTVEEFVAGEALSAGEVVAIDFAACNTAVGATGVAGTAATQEELSAAVRRVKKSATSATGATGIVGVVVADADSGATVKVTTRGLCPAVRTSSGSVAAGAELASSTAGQAVLYASGIHTAVGPFGVALSADAAVASLGGGTYCAAWIFGK